MKKFLLIPLTAALLMGSNFSIAASSEKSTDSNTNTGPSPFYVGFGLTANTPDQESQHFASAGNQSYLGYDSGIKIANLIDLTMEAGFHNTGNFKGKADIVNGNIVRPASYNNAGLWATAVFNYNILNRIGIHAAAGLDLGDDSGLLFGGGLSYKYSHKVKLNANYMFRNSHGTGQANISYHF